MQESFDEFVHGLFLFAHINKVFLLALIIFFISLSLRFPSPFEGWKNYGLSFVTYWFLGAFWGGALLILAPTLVDGWTFTAFQGIILLLLALAMIGLRLGLGVPFEFEGEEVQTNVQEDNGVTFEALFNPKKIREWQEINAAREEMGLRAIAFRHILSKKRVEKENPSK
jgi:hypothetical protein